MQDLAVLEAFICVKEVSCRAISTEACFEYFMVTENMWKHAYASGVSPRK